jgi:hypothetical protein
MYRNQGAYGKTAALLRRGLTTETSLIQREAPYLLRNDREAFVESFGNSYEGSFTEATRDKESTNLGLFARLNRQGLLQEIEQRQALQSSLSGPQQSLAEELRALTRQLASSSITPEKGKPSAISRRSWKSSSIAYCPQLRPRV